MNENAFHSFTVVVEVLLRQATVNASMDLAATSAPVGLEPALVIASMAS
jgi:hypothetical protein